MKENNGKKVEVIIREMFQWAGCNPVPFGYEESFPTLAALEALKAKGDPNGARVPLRIRYMPDMTIVRKNKKGVQKVSLVEVKYRKVVNPKEVLRWSRQYANQWPQTLLLIATPKGIFADSVSTLVKGKGVVRALSTTLIPSHFQARAVARIQRECR